MKKILAVVLTLVSVSSFAGFNPNGKVTTVCDVIISKDHRVFSEAQFQCQDDRLFMDSKRLVKGLNAIIQNLENVRDYNLDMEVVSEMVELIDALYDAKIEVIGEAINKQ